MRECAICREPCDSQMGLARELKTTYFGGKRTGVEYGPRIVSFFCSEDHRNEFLATGATAGEVQSRRRDINEADLPMD